MKSIFKHFVTISLILVFSLSSCKKDEVPIVETNSITDITGTSVVCGGNIIDDRGETVLTRGVCWSKNIEPSLSDSKTTNGAGAGSFSSTVPDLLPATDYFIRAYATNSSGTGYGMVMSFKTLGQAPLTTTVAASDLTTTTAKLSATINANYLSTNVTFEFGLSTSYGSSVVATQSPVTGSTLANVTTDVTGLTAGTTYHYRVKAENSLGITYGDDKVFTTLGLVPASVTLAASNTSTSSVTLNGTVNANYLSTTVVFEYGTTTGYGNSTAATPSPVTGSTIVNVSKNLTGLSVSTIYHYRVKAENSLGITYGDDKVFTTLGLVPTSLTLVASSIGTSSVTLNGIVNANYLSTTVVFEYGLTPGYGNSIAAIPGTVTGYSTTGVSRNLTGLSVGTLYHYRVKAENSLGITYGNDMTFTTLGMPPTASTENAGSLSSTSATLRGLVSANYISTTVTFEYGTSTSYGTVINASPNIVTGTNLQSVIASVSGLTTGTTYHFRVKAENSIGTTYGTDLTFVAIGPAPIADVDGNTYSVVNIGTQTWMAENLRTTKYNDNTSIPLVTSNTGWIDLTTPGYCWYNNDEASFKNPYGGIYNWYAVNTGKLCPAGWHVPTNAEFTTLTNYLGGISVAGGKLKETGTTRWTSPNTGATNSTGFGAVPGGQRDEAGAFIGLSLYSIYWTSTPYNTEKPWYRSLSNAGEGVFEGNGSFNIRGFSIRCIKD
jgi:uncharacterized protein (TIGR02145 family)